MAGAWKHANIHLRLFGASTFCALTYLTLILGSCLVTRTSGSMCPSAPSLVSGGDLPEPHPGRSRPPLGVHGSLRPRARAPWPGLAWPGDAGDAAPLMAAGLLPSC